MSHPTCNVGWEQRPRGARGDVLGTSGRRHPTRGGRLESRDTGHDVEARHGLLARHAPTDGDGERGDAGLLVAAEPSGDPLRRAQQGRLVDELEGHGRRGLAVPAGEVEVLDARGILARSPSGRRAGCRSSARASPCRRCRARSSHARGRPPPRRRRRARRAWSPRRRSPPSAVDRGPGRPARRPVSSVASRSPACSGLKKIASQPSAISPVSSRFFGPDGGEVDGHVGAHGPRRS